MTPAAVTPAGRAGTKKRGPKRSSDVAGHRRNVTQRPAPKVTRRVSGPARGRVSDTIAPLPRPARSRTRRSSTPFGVRCAAFVRALPDHPLLDRLIRGRIWIPLLGVMLAGIVAMQVEVLKLNASIGRSIERGTALQNRNEQLRMAVAGLDGDQRIMRLAAAKGMIMPSPDSVGFLASRSDPDAVRRAVQNIHAPDAPGFLSLISSNGAIASTTGSQPTDVTQLSSTTAGSAMTTTPSVSATTTPSVSTDTSAQQAPVGG